MGRTPVTIDSESWQTQSAGLKQCVGGRLSPGPFSVAATCLVPFTEVLPDSNRAACPIMSRRWWQTHKPGYSVDRDHGVWVTPWAGLAIIMTYCQERSVITLCGNSTVFQSQIDDRQILFLIQTLNFRSSVPGLSLFDRVVDKYSVAHSISTSEFLSKCHKACLIIRFQKLG